MWDPADPGTGPVELGRHDGGVSGGGGAAGRAGGQRRRATGGCWCGTRRSPGAGPVELGRHDGGVSGGGGAAGRAGGQRRRATAGCWCGTRRTRGRPGRARPPRRRGARGGGAAGRAGGQRRRRRAGAGVGPGATRGPARSSSAATTAGCARWRCCRTGGWSAAAATGGCWCGTRTRRSAGPVELGRHDGGVSGGGGAAGRAGGHRRRTTGGCWCGTRRDPAAGPVELGRHDGGVSAVAVLPDGRVVSGGGDGRVLVWDPADPGAGPVELGRHDGGVTAVAVLPDGRVVSGGGDGRVLVWDPARPGGRPGRARPPRRRGDGGGGAAGRAGGQRRRTTGGCWCGTRRDPAAGPVELGRHDGGVTAVAVLPDGRVVSGGDDGRVLVWDPARPGGRPGRARPPRRRGERGGGAAGRAGGQRRRRRPGAAVGCAKQLTRQSARMLRVRARYLPLPIWSSPFHRSRTGRNFMLGGTRSDTEHAWSPATCGVTRCNNRRECPQGPG